MSISKPIILIGGTAGTGKSTLARELAYQLRIDHRLGTGFVREIVKSQVVERSAPELHRFTFRTENPVENLEAQARRLKPAIEACIARARNEGTSLLVEGTHLIPELYSVAQATLYVVLAAPDQTEHLRRLKGPSHSKRHLNGGDLERIRAIDDFFRAQARRFEVPYLLYSDNLADFAAMVTHGH